MFIYINEEGGGGKLEQDLQRYNKIMQANIKNRIWAFLYVLAVDKTFRNVFYYRIGYWRLLVGYIKGIPTCEIHTREIGGGLFIEHGGAQYISQLNPLARIFISTNVLR